MKLNIGQTSKPIPPRTPIAVRIFYMARRGLTGIDIHLAHMLIREPAPRKLKTLAAIRTWLATLAGVATENVMVIPIREHFGCWGEVFRQIKDVPDGGHVILKVRRDS